MPFRLDPDEVEGRVEVSDLREPHVLGVHGLDQIGPAEVEEAGVVGLGQPPLEPAKSIPRNSGSSSRALQTWTMKTLLSP